MAPYKTCLRLRAAQRNKESEITFCLLFACVLFTGFNFKPSLYICVCVYVCSLAVRFFFSRTLHLSVTTSLFSAPPPLCLSLCPFLVFRLFCCSLLSSFFFFWQFRVSFALVGSCSSRQLNVSTEQYTAKASQWLP